MKRRKYGGDVGEMVEVTVLIPCRDGEDTLPETLTSVLRQTVASHIVVADDASIDRTPQILRDFERSTSGRVRSVTYARREPKDYTRVPMLLSMAARSAPSSDYYMISGDDNEYPPDYLEKLIDYMERDNVDLASGYNRGYRDIKAPTGGGRVVSASLWSQLKPLPKNCAWDTWMLFRALQLGKKYKVYPVEKRHLKERRFVSSFGHASHLMGTPLVFTLLRMAKIVVAHGQFLQALSILTGQLEYTFRKVPQMEIAPFVHHVRKYRIKKAIMERFA